MLRRTRGLDKCVQQLIFSLLFWIGGFSLLCVTIPFYLFRQLVKPLTHHFHPDWHTILNTRDTVTWEDLQSDEGLTSVMLLTIVAEGDGNVDKIRNFFNDYILNYKNYKGQQPYSKFLYYHMSYLGYPFWVKAKGFRLENHIRILEEFQHTPSTTQEELETFLGDYNTKPFHWKTPPWELVLVKNYVPHDHHHNHPEQSQSSSSSSLTTNLTNNHGHSQRKKFALIFRWHNSIADGYSIAKIFINVFGGESQHHHHHHQRHHRRYGQDNFLSGPKLTRHHQGDHEEDHDDDDEDYESWWSNFRSYASSLVLLGHDTLRLLLIDSDRNSWRVANENLTNKCHLVTTKKLPFNIARTVSKKRRVSVTTVMFAAVAGGIRQYFIETGQQRRIPKVMRVRVCVPMTNHHHKLYNRLTNNWSFANIKLPVGHAESETRLQRIDQVIESLRTSLIPAFVWLLEPLLYSSLPDWLNDFTSSVKDRRTTMTGWHFLGPKKPLLLFGEYPAVDFMGFVPRLKSDAAIGLTIFSYNGTIRFSLSIDKALFTHRESAVKLTRLIEKEFLDLQNLPSTSNGNADSNQSKSYHHQNPFD